MGLGSYPILSKARIVTMTTVACPVKSLYTPPGTGEAIQRAPCNNPVYQYKHGEKYGEKHGEVGEEVEEDTEEKGGRPQPPSRNEDGGRKRELCAPSHLFLTETAAQVRCSVSCRTERARSVRA